MQHYPEIPKYLYHYTKLETAKKIVQNKTIRFRSLADMDDALEPVAKAFLTQEAQFMLVVGAKWESRYLNGTCTERIARAFV